MSDVFISYSRRDLGFVRKLHDALVAHNRDAWVDWEDILPTAEWLKEIYAGIEAADAFVFIISPDSVVSNTCKEESAHAAKYNKRIVPIMYRDVPDHQVPQPLRPINWIFFRESDNFDAKFQEFLKALDTDLAWVKAHTRLLTRAIEWDNQTRNDSLLLRGSDLRTAEEWFAQSATGKEPKPTPLQTEYILASRNSETRRYRTILGAVTVALIVAIVLAVFAVLQRNEATYKESMRATAEAKAVTEANVRATAEAIAVEERNVALARQLATQAESVLDTYPQRSLLLAAEAVSITLQTDGRSEPVAEQALRDALRNMGGYGLGGHKDRVYADAFSPDGHWLVTAGGDKTARVWDLTAPDPASTARILRGHDDSITAVAISPDGRWVVTGAGDATVRLWDLTTPDPVTPSRVLHSQHESFWTIAISPDGRWLAAGSGDDPARLWDLTDPIARSRKLDGSTDVIAISANGRWLFTSGKQAAQIWDLTASEPMVASRILRDSEGSFRGAGISPDGHWLVSNIGEKQPARLWNLTMPDPVMPQLVGSREDATTATAVSPDNHWLVAGYEDKTVRLWDLTASGPITTPRVLHGPESDIKAVAISPDGHWLAVCAGKVVWLWNLNDLAVAPSILRGHEAIIEAIAFSPDGRWLATRNIYESGIRLWDLTLPDFIATPRVLLGHEDAVCAIAISPDGRWLVSGSADKTVRIWDLADITAQPYLLRGHEGPVCFVAISPDGRWLFTGGQQWSTESADGTLRLWDLTDFAVPPRLLRHLGGAQVIAVDPKGRWLVTSSGRCGGVQLWDLADPVSAPSTLKHEDVSDDCAWGATLSQDGRWLATASRNDAVRLWDLANPSAAPRLFRGYKGIDPFDSFYEVTFSPDGHWLIAGASDKYIQLWNLSDPAVESHILRDHEDAIVALAVSPDGHWLASGSLDKTARLWNLTNLAVAPYVLRGHTDRVNAVAFSPDGHWLATGSSDRTIRLWTLRLNELVDLACRTVGRNLTQAERIQYLPSEHYRKTCPQWPEGE